MMSCIFLMLELSAWHNISVILKLVQQVKAGCWTTEVVMDKEDNIRTSLRFLSSTNLHEQEYGLRVLINLTATSATGWYL